jgi:hypothetical protein
VKDGGRSKAGVLQPAVNETAQVKKETKGLQWKNTPDPLFQFPARFRSQQKPQDNEKRDEREKKTVLLAVNETARVEKKTEDLNQKMRRIRTRNCPTAFTTPDEEEEEELQQK